MCGAGAKSGALHFSAKCSFPRDRVDKCESFLKIIIIENSVIQVLLILSQTLVSPILEHQKLKNRKPFFCWNIILCISYIKEQGFTIRSVVIVFTNDVLLSARVI